MGEKKRRQAAGDKTWGTNQRSYTIQGLPADALGGEKVLQGVAADIIQKGTQLARSE